MSTKNNRPKTVAIVQARMDSSRFPYKILEHIQGKSVLQRVLERLSHSTEIDEVVVAVPTKRKDTLLAGYVRHLGFSAVQGSEDDVLSRVLLAARVTEADIIVDITSDCPMIDWRDIDKAVRLVHEGADYASNVYPRSFPDGLDYQVYRTWFLQVVDQALDKNHPHRAHTGWNIPQVCKGSINMRSAVCPIEWAADWRLTLDTKEDLELLREVYKLLSDPDMFDTKEVLKVLEDNPGLRKINSKIQQKKPGEG